MKCLQDYIGIRYLNGPVPDSGLYINSLPGVSLKAIDKIANEEQVTFSGVWSDVQNRSLKKFESAITNYFAKKWQLRVIHESIQLPNSFLGTDAVNQLTPAAPGYRGITYDLGFTASPMACIHIETLQIYLLAPQSTVTFKVWEVIDNANANLLDTFTLTGGVAGWNTLKVNKDYNVWKIFVGYESTSIDSIWMPLNRAYDMFNQQSLIQWPTNSPCQAWLFGGATTPPYTGGDVTTNDYGNLTELNNTYGLSGQIGTKCGFENIICAWKQKFATALWYAHGSELMIERMFSDRLNRYTTIDMERAQKLQKYFEQMAEKELATVMDGIDLVTWDCCLNCNAQVQLVHNLP